MKSIDAIISEPKDTYNRSLDKLLEEALPKLKEILSESDEVTILTVYRKGDEVKLQQISLDNGVSAPPPDVPSRIREIDVTPRGDLPQDVYIRLAIGLELDVQKYGINPEQKELVIGKFDNKQIFRSE